MCDDAANLLWRGSKLTAAGSKICIQFKVGDMYNEFMNATGGEFDLFNDQLLVRKTNY